MKKKTSTKPSKKSSKTVVADPNLEAKKEELASIAKATKSKALTCESLADPQKELRRIVLEHKNLTRKAVAIVSMCSDRTLREGPDKGKVIPSGVPDERANAMRAVAKALKSDAEQLERAMLRELKKLEIYNVFLSKVFGLGPVVCAYLVAFIDIEDIRVNKNGDRCYDGEAVVGVHALKISDVRRFCGLAVIDGHLERPTRGQKLGYCGELRTRLYQGFGSMWKNAAKKTAKCPNGARTKYLDVWLAYKERMQHSERYDASKNTIMVGNQKRSGKGFINATGRWKAADVLIEDLYTVWRAVEGLPVWPSYYAAKLGYSHGGKIAVQGPRMLTVAEALEIVGDVGSRPALVPLGDDRLDGDEANDIDDNDEVIAAE